jgi:hypothetical protein
MPRILAASFVIVLALIFGGTAVADEGGPDAGGYSFIDNDEDNGPVFSYVDIRATGTEILTDVDDDLVEGVPIGFPFTFYGTDYNTVNISSNGNFRFLTTEVEFFNLPIPTNAFNGPAVFPFWDDLASFPFDGFLGCDDSAGVFYQTVGVAPERRFIIQWHMCHFENEVDADDCTVDVEAILFEGTGEVLFQYADTTFSCGGQTHFADNGASASVGIQQSPTVGLQYSFGAAEQLAFPTRQITAGLAICFYPERDAGDTSGFCGGPIASPDEVACIITPDIEDEDHGIEIDLDNCNANIIDLDNDNLNNNGNNNFNGNFNGNANENENDNENDNEQDQDNSQGQDNTNDQNNNIDSSPEVNIDF